MTTVLVTGAAGFLGRWFAKRHVDAGDYVVGVDDLSSGYATWPDGLRAQHQLDAATFFDAHPDGHFDIAYHLAAPVGGRLKIEGDPLFNADSLRLDAAFFRWAIGRVGIAVYPSSSAVYGAALQEGNGRLLDEAMFHPENPSWFAPDEMYGTTKLVGEFLAYKAERYGLNTLCIRPFSGYGEGQSLEYPVPSILKRAKEREDPLVVWGTGHQRRDFIHVEDLVGATIARLDAGVHGYKSMNISSGVPISFREIAQRAAVLAEYRPIIKVDVTKPSGVASRYGDNSQMLNYYTPMVSLTKGLDRVMRAL